MRLATVLHGADKPTYALEMVAFWPSVAVHSSAIWTLPGLLQLTISYLAVCFIRHLPAVTSLNRIPVEMYMWILSVHTGKAFSCNRSSEM